MMRWRRRNDQLNEEIARRTKEAEDAIIMSQVGYMAAEQLNRAAERVAKGHRRLQRENHFGPKLFGVTEE